MEKRTLLAILLIGVLSAGYFYFLSKNKKKPQQQTQQQQSQNNQNQQQSGNQQQGTSQQSQQQAATQTPPQQQGPQQTRAQVTAPTDIREKFAALGPGITNYNQAVIYLRNKDRIKKIKKDYRIQKIQLEELKKKLNRATTGLEKNRLNAQIKLKEIQIKNFENRIKALIGPEIQNGVPINPTEVKIETDMYTGAFTTKGAVFKNLFYKQLKGWNPVTKRHELMNALNENPNLRDHSIKPFLVAFDRSGIQEENLPVYTYDKKESKELSTDKVEAKVFYIRYFNKGKIFKLVKIFKFHKSKYIIDFAIRIVNESNGVNEIGAENGTGQDGYYLFWGRGLGQYVPKKYRSSYDDEIRLSYYSRSQDKFYEYEKQRENKEKIFPSQADWLGIDNRYFFIGVDIKKLNDLAASRGNRDRYNPVYYGELGRKEKNFKEYLMLSFFKIKLSKKGEFRESIVKVYLGPKNRGQLKKMKNGMYVVSERGWLLFRIIGMGIQWLLMLINSIIHNFGVSIILLTVIIKILLHPLNKKSTESAKKMQLLQPKIQEVNQQYKKDPQLKQKALMELYKKEGINPLGGCLPLILQMPFFFALFQTLPVIVELKNVNFLWIKDLSSPDTVLRINLLITDQLNILPIIMTATSIIQSKLSTSEGGDSKQQKMMMILPIVFLFIFYKMPSGLVLYWTVQNGIQIIQQVMANKKIAREQMESNLADNSVKKVGSNNKKK